jgi:hypothetical protein
LLKNPRDFTNFMYVKSALPRAKFIFIHRHPLSVINSQLRAIRSLFASKSAYTALLAQWYRELYASPLRLLAVRLLFSSHFNIGAGIVTRHLVQATSYFLEHVGDLSNADCVSVRYEDLCRDAETNVVRILRFLGLEPAVGPSYDAFIEPRPVRMLPEIGRKYGRVRRKLDPYFVYCEYDG